MGIVRNLLLGRERGLRARLRGRIRRLLGGSAGAASTASPAPPPPPAATLVEDAPEGFVAVARLPDLTPGAMREVMVGARSVALALVDGTVHAVEGTCPHAGGPLAEGILDGTTLTCPMHGWSFDIATGACHVNPEDRIGILRVRVVGDVVFVAV